MISSIRWLVFYLLAVHICLILRDTPVYYKRLPHSKHTTEEVRSLIAYWSSTAPFSITYV
jgi:hypothetical protein